MLGLVKNELYKVFRLKKLYLFMGTILAIQIAKIFQYKFSPQQQIPYPLNGQSFPLDIMGDSSIFIAMFIAVLVADMIAEEYKRGTFKLVLLRPVSRIQFIFAKTVGLLICIVIMVCFTVITAYIMGAIVFDWGDNVLIQGTPFQFQEAFLGGSKGVLMTLTSSVFFIIPSFGFSVMIMFIALISVNTGITIGSALSLFIISSLLEGYGNIRSYSIIHLMNSFPSLFINSATPQQIFSNLGVIAVYVILFYIGSIILIKRKDVLL